MSQNSKLMKLPPDLLHKVFGHLTTSNTKSVSTCCKNINKLLCKRIKLLEMFYNFQCEKKTFEENNSILGPKYKLGCFLDTNKFLLELRTNILSKIKDITISGEPAIPNSGEPAIPNAWDAWDFSLQFNIINDGEHRRRYTALRAELINSNWVYKIESNARMHIGYRQDFITLLSLASRLLVFSYYESMDSSNRKAISAMFDGYKSSNIPWVFHDSGINNLSTLADPPPPVNAQQTVQPEPESINLLERSIFMEGILSHKEIAELITQRQKAAAFFGSIVQSVQTSKTTDNGDKYTTYSFNLKDESLVLLVFKQSINATKNELTILSYAKQLDSKDILSIFILCTGSVTASKWSTYVNKNLLMNALETLALFIPGMIRFKNYINKLGENVLKQQHLNEIRAIPPINEAHVIQKIDDTKTAIMQDSQLPPLLQQEAGKRCKTKSTKLSK